LPRLVSLTLSPGVVTTVGGTLSSTTPRLEFSGTYLQPIDVRPESYGERVSFGLPEPVRAKTTPRD